MKNGTFLVPDEYGSFRRANVTDLHPKIIDANAAEIGVFTSKFERDVERAQAQDTKCPAIGPDTTEYHVTPKDSIHSKSIFAAARRALNLLPGTRHRNIDIIRVLRREEAQMRIEKNKPWIRLIEDVQVAALRIAGASALVGTAFAISQGLGSHVFDIARSVTFIAAWAGAAFEYGKSLFTNEPPKYLNAFKQILAKALWLKKGYVSHGAE